VSVVAHHQVLNITISTYADELHVTFIALREAVPDVQSLADATQRALVELQQSLRSAREVATVRANPVRRTAKRSRRRAPLPRRPPSM
jgi:hypothetical protein